MPECKTRGVSTPLDRLNAAWDVTGLTPPQKNVLVALVKHSDDSGACWPQIDRLAEMTAYGERTVRKALGELEADGWFVRERDRRPWDGKLAGYRYRVDLDKLLGHVPAADEGAPPAPHAAGPPAPHAAPEVPVAEGPTVVDDDVANVVEAGADALGVPVDDVRRDWSLAELAAAVAEAKQRGCTLDRIVAGVSAWRQPSSISSPAKLLATRVERVTAQANRPDPIVRRTGIGVGPEGIEAHGYVSGRIDDW